MVLGPGPAASSIGAECEKLYSFCEFLVFVPFRYLLPKS